MTKMDVTSEATKLLDQSSKVTYYMEDSSRSTSNGTGLPQRQQRTQWRNWLHNCQRKFMVEESLLPSQLTCFQKLRYAVSCPPHGYIGHLLTLTLMTLMLWAICFALFGNMALGKGKVLALLLLLVGAFLGAELIRCLRLPSLLGMLLAGVALKNVPYVREEVGDQLDDKWSSVIRQIALVIILIRGGVNLDPKLVWRLKNIVLCLSVIPCVVEATAAGIVAHFLLDFPWLWSFLLGFVLSAVSPAVVVPSLIFLQEQGRGVAKGIPTLGIAASSVNQIVAICVFGVLLGVTFAQGNLTDNILQGPIQLGIGLGYGLITGLIAWFLPHDEENNVSFYRFSVIMGGGLVAVLAGQKLNYPGAGALGCLLFAFIAGCGLRKQEDNALAEVASGFSVAWDIFQPLLFALIGAKIDISELEVNLIWKGFLCIVAGLLFCTVSCFMLSMGPLLNKKERLFLALAWIPKATVQAAIGPLALETAIATQASVQDVQHGKEVLTIAVLTILLTAPLGAIAINLSGPRLLEKGDGRCDNQEFMDNDAVLPLKDNTKGNETFDVL